MALIPTLFGLVADVGGLAAALIAPVACYVIIAAFGIYANRNPVAK